MRRYGIFGIIGKRLVVFFVEFEYGEYFEVGVELVALLLREEGSYGKGVI